MPQSWSNSEKQIARQLFDTALKQELSELMNAFKTKVAALTTPEDRWEIAEELTNAGKEISAKYDYRYSQLIFVFGRLLREKRISVGDLEGLANDKIAAISLFVRQ